MLTEATLTRADIDAVALKPTEVDLARARELPADMVTVDFEGREHVPDADTLRDLAAARRVRVTIPVRADGFDPLGDESSYDRLPDETEEVLVAGHPAYLTDAELRRAIAPRLLAARERAPGAWVGTESIERLALAVGGTQFELLSGTTERDLRRLRETGHEGELAVYAPTVLSDDPDAVLDAVGGYVARRGPVARTLPDGTPTGGAVEGPAREILLSACRRYALVGSIEAVRERVAALREAGADRIVGYPARGLDEFLE